MEEDATLASVLAFLEAFDAPNDAEEACSSTSCISTGDLATPSAELSEKEARKRERLQRRRLERYTTQLQRRKRAELAELREQASDLEHQLALLEQMTKLGNVEGGDRSDSMANSMKEDALKELRKRREAEKNNTRLRTRLQQINGLWKELNDVVAKHKKRRNFVDEAPNEGVQEKAVLPPSRDRDLWTGSAQQELHDMYMLVDRVLSPLAIRQFDSCWLESSALGIGTEIRSSTVSECSVNAAEKLLWRNPMRRQYEEGVLSDVVSADGTMYSKSQVLPVICRPWSESTGTNSMNQQSTVEVKLHVQHYARRIQEPTANRVIIILLAHIRVPALSQDLLLQEKFWTSITQTRTTTTTLSCYRIGPGNPSVTHLTAGQKSIVRALTFQTRQNHATLQNWLLDAAEK